MEDPTDPVVMSRERERKALLIGWNEQLEAWCHIYRSALQEIAEDCGHDKPDIGKIRQCASRVLNARMEPSA